MSDLTVLLTGAAGLIGSEILRLLEKSDVRVVAFDKAAHPSHVSGTACRWIRGDICDPDALRDAIASNRVRRVIHAASVLQADCQRNPHLGAMVNVAGTSQILETASTADVDRVVFTSSIAVYGGTLMDPMAETHPCAPKTIYGTAKLLGEQLGAEYAGQGGFDFTALRYGLVYGPGKVGSAGIASRFQNFVRAAIRERVIRIPRSNPKKPFLFSSDAAAAAVHACLRPAAASGVFNISGPGYTMSEVAEVLGRMCAEAETVYEDQKPVVGEVDASLDTTRAERDLGFRPSISLEEGLDRVRMYLGQPAT